MTTDQDREPFASGESVDAPGANDAATAAAGSPAEPAAPADTTDYKDRWLRTEADLQNFRRRAARDLDETRRGAEERVLLDVIGVLDDLERALGAMGERAADDPLAQGVALTAQRVRDLLGRFGITAIESVGRPFDPVVHDALLEVDAPEGTEPGTVVQEVQKGWRSGDRALRAARVVVARARAES